MPKEYLTVVFEYEPGDELPKSIMKAFADDTPFQGVRIAAVSLEDEIARLEKIEDGDDDSDD
jgi:hypothetical protein